MPGCSDSRVTRDCRDAAVPPLLGTQYRDSEFHREGLPEALLFAPEKQNRILKPPASGKDRALKARDTKAPFAELGLGFKTGVTKTMRHTEAQLPHGPRAEGTKGGVPWNDYSNVLMKSLFLSEPDWRASSSRGMDGQTPPLITA